MKPQVLIVFTFVSNIAVLQAQQKVVKKEFKNYKECIFAGPTACIDCDPLCKNKDRTDKTAVSNDLKNKASKRDPNCWGKDPYHCGSPKELGQSCTYTWYEDGSAYTAKELRDAGVDVRKIPSRIRKRCAYRCPDKKSTPTIMSSKFYLFTKLLTQDNQDTPALQVKPSGRARMLLAEKSLVEETRKAARAIFNRQEERMLAMSAAEGNAAASPSKALVVATSGESSRLLLESKYTPHQPVSRYRKVYFQICLLAPPIDHSKHKRELRAWKTPCDYEIVNSCSNTFMRYKDTLPILEQYCQILYDFYCCIVQLGCHQSWDESLSDLEVLMDDKKCVNETWAPKDECAESRGRVCVATLGDPTLASCQVIADFRYCMQDAGCNEDHDFIDVLRQVDIIDDKCQFQCNRCDPGCKNKARCKDFFGCVECNLTSFLDKRELPFKCVGECPTGWFPNFDRECVYCDPLASELPAWCPSGAILTTLSPVLWSLIPFFQLILWLQSLLQENV